MAQGATREKSYWSWAGGMDGRLACWIGLLALDNAIEEDMSLPFIKVWENVNEAPIGCEYTLPKDAPTGRDKLRVMGYLFDGASCVHAGSNEHLPYATLKLQLHFRYITCCQSHCLI